MSKKCTKLPNKPSALLDLALDDLERAEKRKELEIDMGTYCAAPGSEYNPIRKKCLVCLAGSVMVGSLGYTPQEGEEVWPYSFPVDTERKLDAIDLMRRGELDEAYNALGVKEGKLANRSITSYDASPHMFKKEMRQLARDFRAVGE